MSTVPPRSPIHRSVDELAQPPRRELHFDPLLAVAAIGLVACSLVVLGVATRDDVPGQPHYFLYRWSAGS